MARKPSPAVQRQFPKPAEILELMQFKTPTLDPTDRRLEKAMTIADLRAIAKRRTPKAAFDYTDGAAEGELSISRARQAFEDVEFHPSVLRNVPVVDTTREVLGGPSALPFGIAPTGFTRLMQTEGETAGAGAAAAAGIPFTLSTLGTTSIEGVKAANPNGRNWFQLYVMRDREISYELTRRAAAAGFDTLFFTVDTPVAGARLRDKRNGFSIPPQLTLGTVVNAIPRPAWWINFLTTPKLEFASLSTTGGTVGELLDAAMDPTISFDDLDIIRSMWPGRIVVKGVQTVEDAKLLADRGVDGIVLSNHGGRQLDRAPIPFHLLPHVVSEVGSDLEVHLDTGIMNGADIVASVALGARFTLVGRAYLYGLMAGGRRGVDKTISILRTEIERTMKLLEVSTLDELGPQHVTQLARLQPVARPVQAAAEQANASKPTTVRSPRSTAAKPAAAKSAAAKPGTTAKPAAAKSAAAKSAAAKPRRSSTPASPKA
ncbi:alpha-hydroxy acid oxidase [Agromyces sp. LHK192]|uniref:alpha-hydroxy acid oxidase n=1 Tax=Agromyces sp. LHK192 TaxID=2498704 RepID=UPI000FDB9BE1|nr:alpha-hydroxy acid oxidase [Agromyces sp. LHK192]